MTSFCCFFGAVVRPHLDSTAKGVFLSALSAIAFYGTTRLASGFQYTKKRLLSCMRFFKRQPCGAVGLRLMAKPLSVAPGLCPGLWMSRRGLCPHLTFRFPNFGPFSEFGQVPARYWRGLYPGQSRRQKAKARITCISPAS